MVLLTIQSLVGNPKWIEIKTNDIPSDYKANLVHINTILRITQEAKNGDGVNIIFLDGTKETLKHSYVSTIGENSSITSDDTLYQELLTLIVNSNV